MRKSESGTYDCHSTALSVRGKERAWGRGVSIERISEQEKSLLFTTQSWTCSSVSDR